MNNPPREDQRDSSEAQTENTAQPPNKRGSLPESWALREIFPEAGEEGLANEPRPGLGTRSRTIRPKQGGATPHDAEPLGRAEPLPPATSELEPREQSPDSLEHEQERDTGVSGQSSG